MTNSFEKSKQVNYVRKIGFLKIWKISKTLKSYERRENAVCALYACRERAVNTLQQFLARRKSAMDTIWYTTLNLTVPGQ